MAARIAVVVVPMFDPRVRGYALSRLMTPMPVGSRTTRFESRRATERRVSRRSPTHRQEALSPR